MKLTLHNADFRALAVLLLCAAGAATPVHAGSPAEAESAFLAQNDQAMTRMMTQMTIRPSGDVDRDFVAMMVPHHQGAIDMAQAVLRYGRNEQLRRIAQEIIVEQQQEITAMRLALGQPLPPAYPAPTGGTPAPAVPAPPVVPAPPTPAHHDMHM